MSTLFVSIGFAARDGKTLYKKCRGCHGINGRHIPFERKSGFLAGRNKEEIKSIIQAIKNGSYPSDKLNNIMQKTISKFSDAEVEVVSEYISRFKK